MSRYVVTRCSNRDADDYVTCKQAFKASNTYGQWEVVRSRKTRADDQEFIETAYQEVYVVYSYGPHWPMYVFDPLAEKWFGNESKYSRTTTRHASDLRPRGVDITWCDVDTMRRVASMGIVEYIASKVRGEEV